MAWWVVALKIIGYLASTYSIIKYLVTPFNSPKASGLSDFSIPTADASRAIPVVFGTVKITGANVVAYGDFGCFGFTAEGSKGKAVGHYYHLGMDMVLCMGPVDSVGDLRFEDKTGGYDSDLLSDGLTLLPTETALWGGKTSGGGVRGQVDCYFGGFNQEVSSYMLGLAGETYSAMPGVCHAVFRNVPGSTDGVLGRENLGGFYWGTQPYIKPVSFVVERCPNTLGMTGGAHRTHPAVAPSWGYDANPACIIYEILTDTTWGLGLALSMIDVDSFLAVGDVLAAENFGMSMIVENQAAANELIADVLRHIDGELYADPDTGQLVLSLVRALSSEQIAALPVFDESNLSNVEFSRGSWSETYNTVKINFISRYDNWTPRVVQWQDMSNLQKRGGELATLQVDFEGVATAEAASQVAARVMRGASSPFAKLRLFANRQAWRLRPGAAIKVNWPALGIVGMVCRVVRPASGELVNGVISLDAVEDTFAMSGTAFGDPGTSGWFDPIAPPTPLLVEGLMEAPYQFAGSPSRYAMCLAARSSVGALGYRVSSDENGGVDYVLTNTIEGMTPTGLLAEDWPIDTDSLDAVGFAVNTLIDAGGLQSTTIDGVYGGVNLAVIDNEIISWQSIEEVGSARQLTNVLRGVMDTLPAAHSYGARIWFLGAAPTSNLTNPDAPYTSDGTISAKLCPFTLRAVLPVADAARLTCTMTSRALRPYPPGRVRLNGNTWADSMHLTNHPAALADVVVTWAHRHRIAQAAAGVVVSQDAVSFVETPEGTYTIQVHVDGTLRRTVTGLTGTTWTWGVADQNVDIVDGSVTASITIIPVIGALSGPSRTREFLV
jgi:hypothetical protein